LGIVLNELYWKIAKMNETKGTVIVTGNAGFIGRYLTLSLVENGYFVVGMDIVKMDDKYSANSNNFRQEIVDLTDIDAIDKACSSLDEVAFVFHTVAMQPTSKNMEIQEYLNINFRGSSNLISICDKYGFKNIILSSSFSIYGKPEYLPMDEKHPTVPGNPYGISKLLVEQLYEYYSRMNGFHITVLRYDGVYGNVQTIPGFVQYLIHELSEDKEIELFHNGEQIRDNVFVEDVVNSNMLAMEQNGKNAFEIFNISGDDPKKSHQTASIVSTELKSKSSIIKVSKTSPMGYDIYMSNDKAKKVLGYKPNKLDYNIKRMFTETAS